MGKRDTGFVWSLISRNRASSVSVMSAALIASLLLSLLCSFFYNMWRYDVESVMLSEGDWQARIVGAVSEETLNQIRGFGNIEQVKTGEEAVDNLPQTAGLSAEAGLSVPVVDLYFHHKHTIYRDMTLMSQKLGLEQERITFNYPLLSMYFIRVPGDDKPRMLLPLYAVILLIVSFSLIIVIHNSFAVSMNAKLHQLGILSSVGATPRQIRNSLMQEALLLCLLPIIGGSLFGIGGGYGLIRMMEALAEQVAGRNDVIFRYHPLLFALTILVSLLTVFVSAWIPAKKLAKLTPLEAIRGAEEMQLGRKKHSPVLFRLFGIEGELAGNALKAQKKALRTSTISLTLAFLGFTVMLSFFKLSDISTDYTYFARYQDVWDVMATVKNVRIEDFGETGALQEAVTKEGALGCVVYQKAKAAAQIPAEQMSEETVGLGGVERLAGEHVSVAGTPEQGYLVPVQLVILDDAGFIEYCEETGMPARLDGAVVINRIWDSVNSNFRYPAYVPYVKEDGSSTILYVDESESVSGEQSGTGSVAENAEENAAGKTAAVLPVLGYTDREPVLREEYDDYALVHIVPLSLWKELSGTVGQSVRVEPDVFVRVLMDRQENDAAVEENLREKNAGEGEMSSEQKEQLLHLGHIEEIITQTFGQDYDVETENRVQEKISNDKMIGGYQIIIGVFCVLLAVIGIANVFSYTMGFMRVRRRECARYLSVGMTPESLKKMFRIEMLVIAGRPVLITLPLTVAAISFMIRASYLNPVEFWGQAPYMPTAVFIMAVFGFVAAAYAIGGRKILHDSLVEALRNETVM